MKLSVIICTYNPRPNYLQRTLEALKQQTLPPSEWELIVVDNNSSPKLDSWIDLRAFPNVTLLTETKQGFSPALVKALGSVRTDLCVLVHDDNLLQEDYLTRAHNIAFGWPMLGAWGGHYEPEYEEQPNPSLSPFLAYLAVNQVKADRWSNALYDYPATPCGAGMVVRSSVLRRWMELSSTDIRRLALGRHKDALTSCEDFDIAFTAIDLGYGTGVFTALNIRHLVPKARVQPDYLRKLVEGHGYSSVFLHSFRGEVHAPRSGIIARLRHWRYLRTLPPVERQVRLSLERGENRAFAQLARRA